MKRERRKLPRPVRAYLRALKAWARNGRPYELWGLLEARWSAMNKTERALASRACRHVLTK